MIINERIVDSRVIPITQLRVGDYFKMSETGSIRGKLYKVTKIENASKGSQDYYIYYQDRKGHEDNFQYDTTERPTGDRFVTWVGVIDDRM